MDVRVEIPTELGRTSLFGNRRLTATAKNVADYFEKSGFTRWSAIYGESHVPPIWRVIRDGHALVMARIMEWIADDRPGRALDAGCGTGALTLQLADAGYAVDAFDVSGPMVAFAQYNTQDKTTGVTPTFSVGDIAAIEAEPLTYDLVCCLDVLFHYPLAEVQDMLPKLAAMANRKLVGTFALRTPLNAFWMEVGQKYFHQKNRMTNLHLLSYDDVERILYRAGFQMKRTHRVRKFFYDSFVFEAVRRR